MKFLTCRAGLGGKAHGGQGGGGGGVLVSLKGTSHVKKNVFFRALPELENTLYIFLYDGRKRCTSCPKEGEGLRQHAT